CGGGWRLVRLTRSRSKHWRLSFAPLAQLDAQEHAGGGIARTGEKETGVGARQRGGGGCAVRQVERCQAGEGGEPFAISPLPCFSGDRRHLPLQLCSAGAPRGGAGRSSRRRRGYH